MSELPPIDSPARRARLEEVLGGGPDRPDALLVLDLLDVRWACGFGGSHGWLVVRDGEMILGTDGRYADRAAEETAAAGATVVAETDPAALRQRMIEACGTGSVGLDGTAVTHRQWSALADDLDVRDVASPIGVCRRVKDPAEIARIDAAAATADAALADVEPTISAAVDHPVSEADLRTELEYRMRYHGADDRSYETIVASGPEHGARPHHEVSGRTLQEGDTLIIDVGGLVDGYHSDMTRSWVIGEPTREQAEWYDLVHTAQRAGLDALRAGITAGDLDRACRSVFEDAGVGQWFIHGTGHGVGLQIHESPFARRNSAEPIDSGNVVTVEPGLYRGGFGGFRIEDLVVVTDDGCRRLTHAPVRPVKD
jgi:Xaa-Pro aminopeptidase